MRAKQSARRRSKTYILLLTNLLHRSSARQRRDETRAGPFRPTLTGAIPRPSVDFFAIRTGTPDGYHCQGDVSAYAPCLVVTHDPPRKPWKISKNYRSRAGTPFFANWKFVGRSRLFGEAPRVRTDGQSAAAAEPTAKAASHTAGVSATGPHDARKAAEAAGKPLTKLKIAYAGKVGMAKLKKIVTKLGGENTTILNSTV